MKNMRAVLGIATNDLRQEVKSGAIIGNIIVAVILALLLGFIMGLVGTPKNVSVAVYDQHESIPLPDSEELSITKVSSEEEARNLLRETNYAAALLSTDQGIEMILDDSMGTVIMDTVKANLTSGLNSEAIPAQINQLETDYLYGFDVNSDWFSLKLVAGQLIPLVVFMFSVVIIGKNIVAERETKTIFELAMAPVRPFWVVIGKIIGGAITMLLAMMIVQILIRYGFGVEANGDLWVGLFASVLMGFGFLGFAYLLSSILPTVELYDSVIGIAVVMPMLLISGVFVPIESFPESIQLISEWSPLTWAVEVVKDTTFREASFSDVIFNLNRLTAFFVGMIIIGSFLVGKMLKESLRK